MMVNADIRGLWCESIVHVFIVFAGQVEQANDEAHARDQDRVPKADVRVAARILGRFGSIKKPGGNERRKAAEDAVANVVRQRHGRVADARGEQFHQERRDRAVHHRHIQDLDEHQKHHHPEASR